MMDTWPIAGMPSPLPTDIVPSLRMTESFYSRLEAISFFLVVLLASTLIVRFLWNRLTIDFPRLPRLSVGRAAAVVAAWGLLFLVVLTLIAATREVMSPGIWEKQGLLYRVPEQPAPAVDNNRLAERTRQLERLKTALWLYAAKHAGHLPPADDPAVPAAAWQVPGGFGLRYLYNAGPSVGDSQEAIAYEPALYGQRLALRTDGTIAPLTPNERATVATPE